MARWGKLVRWSNAGLLFVAATLLSSCKPMMEARPVVQAGREELNGEMLADKIAVFRGVPYAAAPIGALRWKEPQSHKLRTGPQDATQFGAACPQDQGNPDWYRDVAKSFGGSGSEIASLENISEDCLFLNVWTPKAEASAKLPVMVWIHGGSNVNGWAYEPNYLGHNLAANGVVMVSINYRLGALGFMAHPALNAENPAKISGHYGLMDQVAALQWVRDNIAAFGGDASNVTVFGESAGGGDIAALIDMESAKGLFARSIIESGSLGPGDRLSLSESEAVGVKLASALGAQNAEDMRKLDWRSWVDGRKKFAGDHYFAPIADGVNLRSLKAGANKVPLLIGSNRDEWRMYLPDDVTEAYRDALAEYGGNNQKAIDSNLTDSYPNMKTRADRMITAAEFMCPAAALATNASSHGHPSYLYYFTRARKHSDEILAYHGAEIPYAFDTADNWLPSEDTDRRLTSAMIRYWTNFAKSGDPNGMGLEHWPKIDPEKPSMFELGDEIAPMPTEALHICELLKGAELPAGEAE
jgi:para-nitrobenzyl esterase